MKWGKAYSVADKKGNRNLLPEAIQSPEGYRCLRQRVGVDYVYTAWQPAPELQAPHLKLLSYHDDPEAAKQACEEHYKQTKQEQAK